MSGKISTMKELVGKPEENYRNQIDLLKYGIEKNKEFIKGLFLTEGLEGIRKVFVRRDANKFGGEKDEGMNIGVFLEKITSVNDPSFKIIFEDFDFQNIYYYTMITDKDTTRHLKIECDYNQNNFNIVEKIYFQAFGTRLRDEKVDPLLAEFYASKR